MLNYKKPAFWVIVAAVVACAVVTVCFATNPIPTSENTTVLSANYSVERVLYAVTFDGEASVEPPLQYCVTADYLLYVQQTGGEDWKYLGALTPYELTNDELNDYVPYNQRRNIKVRQITDAYILRVEDDNFYLVFQTISGDTYLSYGWEDIGERGQGVSDDTCLRCLYHLNRDPNENDAPRVDEPTPDGGGQPAPKEPDVSTLSAEQAAIRQAILDYNGSPYHKGEYDVACCSFITLETLSGTPLAGSNTNKITYYGWAFYEEYRVTDNGLETGPCSHTPVALSFDVDERGYTLTEYWTPGDGSNYAPDIWKKFPLRIVWDALDNQKFILQQTQECYEQAIAATGLDTGKVIGSLLDTICSSPAQSSDPEDYIKEHSIDYRELTYYGRYTLEYCFTEFLKGGQTDLRGHIMRAAIDDIAPEARLKLYAETGQEYFDAWKDAAISVGERHDMEWIETNQPAVYLLLNMLGEV